MNPWYLLYRISGRSKLLSRFSPDDIVDSERHNSTSTDLTKGVKYLEESERFQRCSCKLSRRISYLPAA